MWVEKTKIHCEGGQSYTVSGGSVHLVSKCLQNIFSELSKKRKKKQKKNKVNNKTKQCWLKMVILKLSFKLTTLNCRVFLFLVNCHSFWNVYFYKLACFFSRLWKADLFYLFIYFIYSSFRCSPRFCDNFCCCSYDIDDNVHDRMYTCGG